MNKKSQWKGKSRFMAGFSLTELMVVIAILVIMMMAAAPIFVKSSQRARQASRELVKGHLQRARAHAIATRTYTAFVIADYAAGADFGGKMLGIAEVEKVASTEPPGSKFQITRSLQRWEPLPGNTVILSQPASRHTRATIMEVAERSPMAIARRPVTGTMIVFSPNGQIVSPISGAMEIAIGQGRVVGGQVTATESTNNRVSYDLLQVNRLTGRARLIDPS
jgi:prepilin-type N-terminal cleavage/methylation domain-containing protein